MLRPLLLIVSSATFFLAFASGPNEFSYSRPRAMMALCSDLRRELGVLITYEDAPYDTASELTTSIVPRNGNKVLTPDWRPITFQLMPTVAEQSVAIHIDKPAADDMFAAISDLASQYSQSGNPGRFAVKKDGKYVHVQQTLRMNTGSWETVQPISETLLAWQSEPKSCYTVLSDLSQALKQARGFSIAMGSLPIHALMMHHCDIQGLNLTVGEGLERIMKQLDTDLASGNGVANYGYAWDLVYDPNWNVYFLSIDLVQDRVPRQTAAPATRLQAPVPAATPNESGAGGRLVHRQAFTGSAIIKDPVRE